MLPVNVLNMETGVARVEKASLCPLSMKLTGRGEEVPPLKGGTRKMVEVQWMNPEQQSMVFLACRSQTKTKSV